MVTRVAAHAHETARELTTREVAIEFIAHVLPQLVACEHAASARHGSNASDLTQPGSPPETFGVNASTVITRKSSFS